MNNVGDLVQARRVAHRNALLEDGALAARLYLEAGDVDSAVRVLQQYAPKIDQILEQERLYAEEGAK